MKHLLSMGFLVALSVSAPTDASAQEFSPPQRQPGDLEIYANRQDGKDGMFFLRGSVELRQDEMILRADEVDYNENTGDVEARGAVHYLNPVREEDLYAEKFAYNLDTELGTFYNVYGTVASASQGGAKLLTTDNPFYLEGAVVHKVDGDYIVHNGFVTNCDSNHPWWTLRAPRTRIRPGKSATIHRGVFRLRGVPLFYFPYFQKSLERLPRRSGFLTPNIGNSSRFGFVLGQTFYWAINRSYDATINGTWYTDRGLASQIAFRGRPTESSYFDAFFYGVKDRGFKRSDGSRVPQGGRSLQFRGAALLPGGFRGVADVNTLSSLQFRQAFTQTFQEAVVSQVRSIGFVSKNFSTFSINAAFQREENFQSILPEDTVIIRKLPSVEFNSRDRQLVEGPIPLFVAFDSSMELVSRSQPLFQTRNFVQRGDFYPRVSSKFYFKGFHFRPVLGARSTFYGQRRTDQGVVGEDLVRTTREFSLEISPPSLARIYDGPKWLGDKVKHVIEPRLKYRFVDGVEDFDQVIRFDERDLVSNTNEAEIQLTNRLYAKNAETGRVREVFSVDVWQRRYFDPDFGGALVPGRRNVFSSTVDLTPFAFADQARSQSPIISTVRIRPRWNTALEWRNGYDTVRGKLVSSGIHANYLRGIWSLSIGHNAVRTPTVLSPPSNQLVSTVRVGNFNRRGWNAGFSSIYDYRQAIFIYNVIQTTYNTDCCGFSFEFRRFAIGRTRTDNQFRVALTIANVGSFGTLNQRERLN